MLLLEILDVSIFEFIYFVQVHVEDAHLIAQAQVPVEITENDEIKNNFINEKNKNN